MRRCTRFATASVIAATAAASGAHRPVALPAAGAAAAQVGESKDARDARMAWFREAKFGLFIHWGVYAVPAGTYKGEQVKGIGEWIMNRGKIPVAEYKAFAPQFTASKYDPDAWAALAKKAGMRYIVITSKHHDGFALFDSKASTWDAVDAAGAKRDLIKPLADAARRQGLRFGLYYSQAQDWTHPGGAKSGYKEGESWDEANKGDFDAYLKTIAIPQTREILTQIQPDILWWDTPTWMTPERAAPLHALLALKPGIISNNRLGGNYPGDTETPEQYIPATGFKGRDWEVCMTMNDTWGFKSYDLAWKSTEDLIRKLCDIVSKGGNFLLNVGPTAEGEIPAASIERLTQVGEWMKVNGEAIYGTTASPFRNLPWGRCTRKVQGGIFGRTTTLFLHVFDWPSDGKLVVPGLKNKPGKAKMLACGSSLDVSRNGEDVVIAVPKDAPDKIASVVVLEAKGEVETAPFVGVPEKDGSILLQPENAETTGVLKSEGHMQLNLGYWVDPKDTAAWRIKVAKAGVYDVSFDAGGAGLSKIVLIAGDKRLEIATPNTGDFKKYKAVKAGSVELAAGVQVLRLEAVAAGWKPVNVRTIKLTPKK
jgi:alpha-L-fucosidase